MEIDLNDLTIGQAKALARTFARKCETQVTDACADTSSAAIPVIVCTDKRGVVFGYTTNASARPIALTDARMCLYWSADVGGVFGLGEKGPTSGCKISATVPGLSLEGVTAVFTVDPAAEKAWKSAKVTGR